MAGTAQANRTRRDASGGPSGCHPRLRKQSVWRHPGRGTVARGSSRSTCATPRRSSAASRPLRALPAAA
jgi:hypothetical protein